MKKLLGISISLLILFGLSGAASAFSINYLYSPMGTNEFTSPYSGVAVETFDSPLLWIWDGNFQVMTDDHPQASAPAGTDGVEEDTNFVVAPMPGGLNNSALLPLNTVMVTDLGGLHNYLGLWWGSVDTYNTISFYNTSIDANNPFLSITGSEAVMPSTANGNQTAPSTNLYVNILDLPEFDKFAMTSTQYAFEADNIAVGNVSVPEPSTMLLLGFGLIGLAGFSRRKFRR